MSYKSVQLPEDIPIIPVSAIIARWLPMLPLKEEQHLHRREGDILQSLNIYNIYICIYYTCKSHPHGLFDYGGGGLKATSSVRLLLIITRSAGRVIGSF